MMKRETFLETFLSVFGAREIIWRQTYFDKLYGTILYDLTDEDKQDFVWHMCEDNVPSEDVRMLVQFLCNAGLISGDKLIKPYESIAIPCIRADNLKMAWRQLFDIEVRMIDDGEETDAFYIHD